MSSTPLHYPFSLNLFYFWLRTDGPDCHSCRLCLHSQLSWDKIADLFMEAGIEKHQSFHALEILGSSPSCQVRGQAAVKGVHQWLDNSTKTNVWENFQPLTWLRSYPLKLFFIFAFLTKKTSVLLEISPLTSAVPASSASIAVSSSTLSHSWTPAFIFVDNFCAYLQASIYKYVRGRKSTSFWTAVSPTWKVIKIRLIQTRRKGGWLQSQRPMAHPFWEVIYLMIAIKC